MCYTNINRKSVEMFKRFFLVTLFYVLSLSDAIALSFSNSNDIVSITTIPQYKNISSNLNSFDFLTKIKIKKGWHLYWKNPGDTGDAAKIEFDVQSFETSSTIKQSAPQKEIFEDIITSFIYKNIFYFQNTLNIDKIDKKLPFKLTLRYSACKDECFSDEINIVGEIPFSDNVHTNPIYYTELDNALKSFPKKINSHGYFVNDTLYLKLDNRELNSCKNIDFITDHPKTNIISNLPETIGFNDDNLLQIKFDEKPINYNGIILCDKNAYEVNPSLNESLYNNKTLIYYIVIAFIAGLILNLMPCVLPILSLKALHLLKHGKKSIYSALSYLFGVISSFLLLSTILFYLKSKGEELGWGFQLQSPSFNAFLLLFFFVIFLLMADIIHTSDKWSDKLSKLSNNQSFLTGFFAVIIACPCTGPFMGASIGYAITQPTIIYFSIFFFLGLGYALPFVLIETFPHIFVKFLPKPGRWMLTLKHFLAVPIALTCLWLGWVIFNQLSFRTHTDIVWEQYSQESIDKAIKGNEPVFINFTAKWCLICLLNDKTTLATDEFKKIAKEKKLRLFKADWTNRNKTISEALGSYGRNSIPLYVYYPKGVSNPTILPQILTSKILRETTK